MNASRFIHKLPQSILILIILSLTAACGFGPKGYGVVLLSPNEDLLATGSVVEVEEESSISETYSLSLSEEEGQVEIDRWRIEFFEKREEAKSYAEDYREYVKLYAKNIRDGLAIREEADVSSPRLYKLRRGQELKILERRTEDVTVGSHTGNWYYVLTKDGVKGYCFDYYLDIYNIDAAPEEEAEPDLSKVEEVLSKTYRPIDYEQMQEAGHIKLRKFTDQYGFFPSPEEKSFRIRTFDYSHSFEYEEIQKQNERSYLFVDSGVELRIEDDTHITLIYTKDDINYSPGFVIVEELEEIRKEERERRSELFSSFMENGPSYHSSAYGSIEFMEGGSFVWRRFERLVPRIIPSAELEGGEIRFDHFVGSEIGVTYSGAFSLDFEGTDGQAPVFLYRLEGGKLSIEYVSEKNIENMVVLQRNASPLIMVFFAES